MILEVQANYQSYKRLPLQLTIEKEGVKLNNNMYKFMVMKTSFENKLCLNKFLIKSYILIKLLHSHISQ